MFNPKKVIPTLATGALALTGCGDDPTLDSALNNVCNTLNQCFPDEFAEFFGSTEECTDDYVQSFSGYSGACEGALISYFNCYASKSCEEIIVGSARCDDQFYALLDACLEDA